MESAQAPLHPNVTAVRHLHIRRPTVTALRNVYAAGPYPASESEDAQFLEVGTSTRDHNPSLPTVNPNSPSRISTAASRPERENGSPQRCDRRPDDRPDFHRSTIDIDIDGTRPVNSDDRTLLYVCHQTSNNSTQPIRVVGRGRAHYGGKTKKKAEEKVEKSAIPTPAPPPPEESADPPKVTSSRAASEPVMVLRTMQPEIVTIQGLGSEMVPPPVALRRAEPQREMPPTVLTSTRPPIPTPTSHRQSR
ncbi:hypothetical protein EVAR_32904_1 [Eumeta japonica]|uniref:Uncharacterized protein n=1 Tax=Eumeta variegata TaxID=151549 RepID=A0A4C1VRR4_EUMVA|nr:hypothetical protein EVAR_32904_1 [Eumeta japonica]